MVDIKLTRRAREFLSKRMVREKDDPEDQSVVESPRGKAAMRTSISGKIAPEDTAATGAKKPFLVPAKFEVQDENGSIRVRHAHCLERIFITLEHPDQSILGTWISVVIMVVIVVSCTCYVVATMPELTYLPEYIDDEGGYCKEDAFLKEDVKVMDFHCNKVCSDRLGGDALSCSDRGEAMERACACEPKPLPFLDLIEMFSILAFSIDYILRVGTVWSVPPETAGLLGNANTEELFLQRRSMTPLKKVLRYSTTFLNVIDAIAIIPFWIDLLVPGGAGAKFGFVRVLRLARVFRIFRLGKFSEGLGLFVRTMDSSMPALTLLAFFNVIGSVLFGSMAYFCEKGEWQVHEDFPYGAYMRQDLYANPGRDADVQAIEWELSPFLSIPYAFYWTFVTGTTVGYGDMYPQSGVGKVIAVLCMTAGILVLALPITVIGSNFTREYGAMHGDADDDNAVPVTSQLPPKGGMGSASGASLSTSDVKDLIRQTILACNGDTHAKEGPLSDLCSPNSGAAKLTLSGVSPLRKTPMESATGMVAELQKVKQVLVGLSDSVLSLERQLQLVHADEKPPDSVEDSKPLNEGHSSGRHSPIENNGVHNHARLDLQGSMHNIYHPERYTDESATGSGGFSLQLEFAKHGLTQKVVAISPGQLDDGRVVRLDSFGSSQADSCRSSERHTEPVSETSSDRETDRRASDISSSSGPPTSRRSSLVDLGQTMAGLFTKEETAMMRSVENAHGSENSSSSAPTMVFGSSGVAARKKPKFKDFGKSIILSQSMKQVWIRSRNFENLGSSHRNLRVSISNLTGMPSTSAGIPDVSLTVTCGAKKFRTLAQSAKEELHFDDIEYDMRVPVSTHSGKMMLKHIELEVHCGQDILGQCVIPLSEVSGALQEYRLMSRQHLGARPALAGKGRVLMTLKWMKSDIEDSRHLFGTSMARFLATGRGFKTLQKTKSALYREPPEYPKLKGEQLVLSAFTLSRTTLKSRSLSPGARELMARAGLMGQGSAPGEERSSRSHGNCSKRAPHPRMANEVYRIDHKNHGREMGFVDATPVGEALNQAPTPDPSPREEALHRLTFNRPNSSLSSRMALRAFHPGGTANIFDTKC